MTMDRRLSRGERGMTLVELCIVIVILAIILSIAVASLLRARVSANEAAAIGAMRTINSAQFAYASGCGSGSYATSLVVLGTKPPGNSQGYVSEDLGSAPTVQRSGYLFNVRAGAAAVATPPDCNGVVAQTNYYASAVPAALGQTGTRAFATTQRAGIWYTPGAIPPPEPFGAPSQLVN